MVGVLRLICLGCVLVILQGCASSQWLPPAERWRSAALQSLQDPHTWVPLAGAALFAMDDYDQRVSRSAVEHTPVFGDVEDAEDASDDLRSGMQVLAVVSALAVPPSSGHSRVKRLVVESMSAAVVNELTFTLKDETHRTRPDKSNRESFPSGHASQAFAGAMLTARNIDDMPYFSDTSKTMMHVGVMALASGAAWARVEAQKHYPSDVLFGAALANFITDYGHRLFLNSSGDEVAVTVVPVAERGWGVKMVWFY